MTPVVYPFPIWNIICYLCSIAVLHGKFTGDYRPHVEVYINGVCVKFLIDTGASVSVISEDIFSRIKDTAALESLPVERGFKLKAASGHGLTVVGLYQFYLTLLGRSMQRPLYVMDGLTSSTPIFGIDFICEQQLVVAGDDIFFRRIPTAKWNFLATLSAAERLHVPARTVMCSRLNVRDLRMNKLPVEGGVWWRTL